LLDTALLMLTYQATWTGTAGHRAERIARSSHPTLVPFGNFPTADGWIIAGGSKEKFWQRLALALDRSDLLDDPRFRTFDDRLTHKDALLGEVDKAFIKRATADWLQRLTAAGVPCAPVNDIGAALRSPQAVARDAVFALPHAEFGSVTHVGSPVRVGTTPHRRTAAPAAGEHTRDVLVDVLGYDVSAVERLAHDGVVAGRGLPAPS